MRNAMVVPAEGEPYGLLLPEDGNSSLAIYQKIVGGWIELVPNPHDVTVYCNEEGKILEPPLRANLRATVLFGALLQPWDFLAGDVIVVGPPDKDGNDTDLEDIEGWLARAKEVQLV